MDANQPEASLDSQHSPLPVPITIDAADAIVLNVLSPSSEVPGGRITFPRIHLDTKLSQLKTRIRNVLQAAPAPERQRLIYRGHALLNADATLRQVLRPQGSAEAHSDTYTLHLVLPPGNAPAASVPTPRQPAAQTHSPVGLPQPPTQPGMPNGLPYIPGVQLPQQVLAQAQAAQMMLQNQLNMLQQQLAGHNHQHPHQQAHPHAIPGMPGMNIMPNGMHVTYQVHQQGQPGHQMPLPPGFGFGLPNAANLQAMMQQQQQMPHPAVAGHQPIPTAGQLATNPLESGLPEIHNLENTATVHSNETNAFSAAEQPPVTTRIQETIGPQGQRIRTVVRETVNMTISRHGTPDPAGSQSVAAASPNPFTGAIPGINGTRPSPSPAQGIQALHTHTQPTRHSPLSFMMPPPMSNIPASPSTTMAWILSSPSGPEALLFAPGHGYFSSTPQPTPARPTPTRTSQRAPAFRTVNPQDLPAVAHDGAPPPPAGQAQAAPAIARLPHPNAVPAAQLAEENEFLNFIVGRGWLFLRLYVFTFFISEPNTWRRYFLLAVATFICMLPRENFLQRGMAQVRRHIDTLIGPPAAPRNGAAVPAQANAGDIAAPGDTQPAVNPTPAENAARLLREHEARNPNVVRDVLFRVERAAAMFLASLVPGVGERHVRAREDQRREAERLENERRAREEAERAQAQRPADVTQLTNAEAGSTAVETRDDTGQARERTTDRKSVV